MENYKNEDKLKKDNNLDKVLDGYLNTENQDPNLDCSSGVCVIKGDKSLIERINKKIITEDGRQLLF
jgi:thymidylate kinase